MEDNSNGSNTEQNPRSTLTDAEKLAIREALGSEGLKDLSKKERLALLTEEEHQRKEVATAGASNPSENNSSKEFAEGWKKRRKQRKPKEESLPLNLDLTEAEVAEKSFFSDRDDRNNRFAEMNSNLEVVLSSIEAKKEAAKQEGSMGQDNSRNDEPNVMKKAVEELQRRKENAAKQEKPKDTAQVKEGKHAKQVVESRSTDDHSLGI